ncbi:MAG: 30S ribosomal protein S18 [Candidatus Omnitrophica bacterium]|nr:30S ribosomal protein S18 [Candidatus Omnitrophota bacterium]
MFEDKFEKSWRSPKAGPCKFCKKTSSGIDYKDVAFLQTFTTERGKILPQRMTGCCSKHQRMVARAIKCARHSALMPFQTG